MTKRLEKDQVTDLLSSFIQKQNRNLTTTVIQISGYLASIQALVEDDPY